MAAPTPAGLTGKARYLALKDAQLPPGERFAQAEGIAQEGDCEAAIRLLIDAAKREGSLAARLARRFDPEGFEPAPCFAAPQPDSALVWYQRAAEADIPQAQRRYGELLLAETSGGPVYRDAVAWLRKAAAAGDAAAADRLAALGER
jgi:TPR repeat protein